MTTVSPHHDEVSAAVTSSDVRVAVSAPAKLILFGEHAVVYGKSALAASLNLRTFVELLSSTKEGFVVMERPNLQKDISWKLEDIHSIYRQSFFFHNNHDNSAPIQCDAEFKAKLFSFCGEDKGAVAFLYLYLAVFGDNLIPISLRVHSEVPVGAGLGSSAAYSVALAGILLAMGGKIKDSQQPGEWTPHNDDQDFICSWALQAERIMHGDGASGIDNTISTFGGAILYTKGEPMVVIERMPTLRVLIADTRVSRDTKVLVELVRRRYDQFPKVMEHLLEAIHNISLSSKSSLEGDALSSIYQQLGVLMFMNHQLLCALGVGHPSLDKVVEISNDEGLPTKLTGAGGGGCAFSLVPSEKEEQVESVIQRLTKEGYSCISTKLGGKGITFSNKIV